VNDSPIFPVATVKIIAVIIVTVLLTVLVMHSRSHCRERVTTRYP